MAVPLADSRFGVGYELTLLKFADDATKGISGFIEIPRYENAQ